MATVSRDKLKVRGKKRLINSFKYAFDGLKYAFLYEQKLFVEDQASREAMARWIEYKVLKDLKSKKDVEHILKIKTLNHGSGFKKILKMEKRAGKKPLVRFLIENKDEAVKFKEAINSVSE